MSVPLIADQNRSDEPSRIPDWREILAIVMERIWIGLAVVLTIFAGSYIQLRRSVPHYQSTAVLLVEAQIPRIMNFQDVFSANVRNLEYFNTVINTLHSRQMMEQAVRQSGLQESPLFFPHLETVEQKAAAARGLLQIAPVEKSRLIRVTAEHPDAQIAADLANAVARAYIQQELDQRMNASMQAVDWLREQSVEYREKVEKGMAELQEYREAAQSVSLEEDQNIVIAKLKALSSALTAAETDRIDAESRWRSVQNQLEAGASRMQVAVQMQNESMGQALSAWRAQQQKTVELQQRYREDYPELRDAIQLEQTLKSRFEEGCDLAVHALKSHYETMKEREDGLRRALQEQETQAFSLSRQLVRYNDMKRNTEADQEIYQAMISRMKETSISETLPTEIIRLAEEARPASRPYRPRPQQVLLRGLLLGLAGGIGVIFLLYWGDHRFRRNEEVERALGFPVLASVPLASGKTVQERGMGCHLNQEGELAESFRTLRTIMQVNPATQGARVILITSTQPGEGKSLIASNLAISFAQDSRKTLLIGGDLRRPAVGSIFNLEEKTDGLSEVLKGKKTWQEAVVSAQVEGLDLLLSGAIPSHPSELIGNPRMAQVIEEARAVYDRIVIDSSPMTGVSDVLLLMRHTDGVLFVVRQGVTHSLGAIHAVRRMSDGGIPCLGVLMNGVNLKSFANYYYYRRYGGTYSYHKYGAGSEEGSGS